MTNHTRHMLRGLVAASLLAAPGIGRADVFVQCPGDTNGDAVIDNPADPDLAGRDVGCQWLSAGDGFVQMADGRELYVFGFSDITGMDPADVLDAGIFRTNSPAPLIRTREGQEFYLTLTNVGTHQRPDLFDPHTVHYHGFPNASAIFDGLPESAVAINAQASLTYYYNNVEPGTYMYHCHVEATEHMQMGMLGNLYVEPGQNLLADGTNLNGHIHSNDGDVNVEPYGDFPGPGDVDLNMNGRIDEGNHDRYVYNDGDGSTAYDVEIAIQLQAFDGEFHDASENVQPLPFAAMRDTYPTLNGRGYPETADPRTTTFPAPASGRSSASPPQPVTSYVEANQGQRILLRLSNLGVVQHYSMTTLGLTMRVVGHGARLLRGPGGQDVSYETNVVTLGGGESVDVIIDTTDVDPGTYFLYTSNLNYLSNNEEDFGGYMSEIVVN